MRTGHGYQIDWVACLFAAQLAVSLIVSETVLNTNNDPVNYVRARFFLFLTEECVMAQFSDAPTYHKLVKTTPKPSATKNSSGELVAPEPPPPPLLPDVVAALAAAVVVGVAILINKAGVGDRIVGT
jgi:hypothetical protein